MNEYEYNTSDNTMAGAKMENPLLQGMLVPLTLLESIVKIYCLEDGIDYTFT